jgi:flagellar basal-body rod modification protein FlgD
MIQGASNNSAAAAVDSPLHAGGSTGGLLNVQKDAKEAQTAPQFGEVLQKLQGQYGAKAEKPREIKKVLGKDDFLKIMITQMKHQDPTSPFKADQMAAQMAQFASVEQLSNMNQGLAKLASNQQSADRLAMTGMIGKTVTVDRERFPHIEGQSDSLSFDLPKDAKEVKVSVVSDLGEVLLTKELGPQAKGSGSFTWDGNKSNSLPAKAGNYLFKVEAVDANGAGIAMNTQRTARVVGLSFEGNEAILLVGDNKSQEKVTMRSVVRIEDQGAPAPQAQAPAPAGTAPQAPSQEQAAPGGKAFFTFKKGEGSSNLDPEAAKALAAYQAAQAEEREKVVAAQKAAAPAEEKGFPNGLSDGGPGTGSDTLQKGGINR